MEENKSRVGLKWLKTEDNELINEVKQKKSYEDIALAHGRSLNAIKLRVISNIIYPLYLNDDKTIYELSNKYNIENDMILRYINKMDTNNSIKKSIDNNKKGCSENANVISKLTAIEEKIDVITKLTAIEEKIDVIMKLLNPTYNNNNYSSPFDRSDDCISHDANQNRF